MTRGDTGEGSERKGLDSQEHGFGWRDLIRIFRRDPEISYSELQASIRQADREIQEFRDQAYQKVQEFRDHIDQKLQESTNQAYQRLDLFYGQVDRELQAYPQYHKAREYCHQEHLTVQKEVQEASRRAQMLLDLAYLGAQEHLDRNYDLGKGYFDRVCDIEQSYFSQVGEVRRGAQEQLHETKKQIQEQLEGGYIQERLKQAEKQIQGDIDLIDRFAQVYIDRLDRNMQAFYTQIGQVTDQAIKDLTQSSRGGEQQSLPSGKLEQIPSSEDEDEEFKRIIEELREDHKDFPERFPDEPE